MENQEHHFIVQEVLGAYALGAVDEAERSEVEGHLQDCDVCRKELVDLREAVRLLPECPEPSGSLWKRMMAEVRAKGSQAEHA